MVSDGAHNVSVTTVRIAGYEMCHMSVKANGSRVVILVDVKDRESVDTGRNRERSLRAEAGESAQEPSAVRVKETPRVAMVLV